MSNKKPLIGFEEHSEEDAGSSVPIPLPKVSDKIFEYCSPTQLELVKAMADAGSSASMLLSNVSDKIFEYCCPNQLEVVSQHTHPIPFGEQLRTCSCGINRTTEHFPGQVNAMDDAGSSAPIPLPYEILKYCCAFVSSSAATGDDLVKVDQQTLFHQTLGNELFKKEVTKKMKYDEPISLLGILGESKASSWVREIEVTLYMDSLVGHVPFVSSSSTSGSSHATDRSYDWVMAARDFLFGPSHFRVGRVVADDFSYSGSAWFYERFYVVTCAHVIHNIQSKNKEVLLQLPDTTLIDVEVVYSCPPDKLVLSYKMDIAILRMKQVRNCTPDSLGSLSIAKIEAGEPIWTSKCITAGVLGTEAQNVLQNMLNVGRVESLSEMCTTVSASADLGFSGGPVLDRSSRIIGMIQGGRGTVMKTVAIIPIEEVAKVIGVMSFTRPTLPGLSLPMQIDNNNIPF